MQIETMLVRKQVFDDLLNSIAQLYQTALEIQGEARGKTIQQDINSSALRLFQEKTVDNNAMGKKELIAELLKELQEEDKEKMPDPLKYGQGSIKKRTRVGIKGGIYKYYEIRYYDEYGKRHTLTAKTVEKAEKRLRENNKRTLKIEKHKEIITFGTGIDEWYKAFREHKIGETRNKIHKSYLKNIPETIRAKAVHLVTAEELQTFLNSIGICEKAWRTRDLIAAYYDFLHIQGKVKFNIGKLLTAEYTTPKERQVLNKNDESNFLKLIGNQSKDYVQYAIGIIYTGCRLSEFIRLNENWQTDIDYKSKIITIRDTKKIRQQDRVKGIFYKTRTIPLLQPIESLNFPLPKISKSRFQESFSKVCEQMSIKLTPHDMRHTLATRLDDSGVKEKVIQAILGHEDKRTTRHYKDHITKELLQKAFAKIRKSTPFSTPIRPENDPEPR